MHVCLICWAENLQKIPRLSAGGVGVLHLPFYFGKIQFSLRFLVRKVNETTSPQNLWAPDMWQGQSEQGGRPSLDRRRLRLHQPAACEARQPLAFLRHGLVSMVLTVCWGPLFPLAKSLSLVLDAKQKVPLASFSLLQGTWREARRSHYVSVGAPAASGRGHHGLSGGHCFCPLFLSGPGLGMNPTQPQSYVCLAQLLGRTWGSRNEFSECPIWAGVLSFCLF